MNYEQKYKEALERAKAMIKVAANQEEAMGFANTVFPELKESDNEKIRKELLEHCKSQAKPYIQTGNKCPQIQSWIAWLEKQDKACNSIIWHNTSEEPDEQEELLCEWECEDAIWHDIAFYHADTKTFWNGKRKIENVVKWIGINELIEKQGEQKSILDFKTKDWYVSKVDGKIHNIYYSVDKVEPKFKVGDYIERKDDLGCHAKIIFVGGNVYGCEKLLYSEDSSPFFELMFKNQDEFQISSDFKQKHADKVEPKFKIGDFIVNDYCFGKVIALTDDAYLLDTGQGIPFSCEHTAHLWTIQDAKDGDVLINWNNTVFIFKAIEDETVKFHIAYNEKWDAIKTPSTKLSHLGLPEPQFEFQPATKEQRTELFLKMHEAGYMWNSESKQLLSLKAEPSGEQKPAELAKGEDYGIDGLWHAQRILEKTFGKVDGYQTDDGILSHECAISAVKELYEKKPAWSEEDEENFRDIVRAIHSVAYQTIEDEEARVDWLKSLKEKIRG